MAFQCFHFWYVNKGILSQQGPTSSSANTPSGERQIENNVRRISKDGQPIPTSSQCVYVRAHPCLHSRVYVSIMCMCVCLTSYEVGEKHVPLPGWYQSSGSMSQSVDILCGVTALATQVKYRLRSLVGYQTLLPAIKPIQGQALSLFRSKHHLAHWRLETL